MQQGAALKVNTVQKVKLLFCASLDFATCDIEISNICGIIKWCDHIESCSFAFNSKLDSASLIQYLIEELLC